MTSLLPAAPPRTKLPPLACDCHMHIYGDPAEYPASAASPFRPIGGGDVDNYLKLRRILGLERAVVVQPSAYGTDNRCTLDAVERLGDGARAVVVVDESVGDAELERLTAIGARGLRFFMLPGGVLGWEILSKLAARVAEFGWHVQLQMDGRLLPEREVELARLPCQLVLDHNGKFLKPPSTDHAGVKTLCRLLEAGRTRVKTSGVYEAFREGPPHYSDVAVLAQLFIERFRIAACGQRTGPIYLQDWASDLGSRFPTGTRGRRGNAVPNPAWPRHAIFYGARLLGILRYPGQFTNDVALLRLEGSPVAGRKRPRYRSADHNAGTHPVPISLSSRRFSDRHVAGYQGNLSIEGSPRREQ